MKKRSSVYLVEGRLKAKQLAASIGKAADLDPEGLLGGDRSYVFSSARQELYLALWRLGYSIADVGRILRKHHTSIIHGLRKIMGDEAYEAESAAREASRRT